jgi:hypothetical protein
VPLLSSVTVVLKEGNRATHRAQTEAQASKGDEGQ